MVLMARLKCHYRIINNDQKIEGIISNTEIPLHNGSKIRFMNMPMPEEPLENEEIDNLESIL